MNTKEAAALLNGREYLKEISREEKDAFLDAGLVVVFGGSDDIMQFRGAWSDEFDCYNGGTAHVNSRGLFASECEGDRCPYFEREKENTRIIEAVWDEDGFSWTYRTDIPHETFVIMDDGEKYCRGIVFEAGDAA